MREYRDMKKNTRLDPCYTLDLVLAGRGLHKKISLRHRNHITTAFSLRRVVQLIFTSSHIVLYPCFSGQKSWHYRLVHRQPYSKQSSKHRGRRIFAMFTSKEREGAASPGPGAYYSPSQMSKNYSDAFAPAILTIDRELSSRPSHKPPRSSHRSSTCSCTLQHMVE